MVSAADDDGVVVPGELKKTRKRRKRRKKVVKDEALSLQRRARYLLVKIKSEQNLIDAYSGEGWKGQSREKIRPEKELQRAYKQILKCKLGIRDAVRQLESLGSVGSMEDSVIAPDGSVHHENIICANCKLREAFPDNDIILCDGICNCAFHQNCLDPPLSTENIPPEDQGWYCKFCICRMDIIDAMNAHLGTKISMDSCWQDIFVEEASVNDGADDRLHSADADWPSDDSEDDDYDPEKIECSCSTSLLDAKDSSSNGKSESVSISWSFEEEDFCELRGSGHESEPPEEEIAILESCADSQDTANDESILGPRQRRTIDYKRLYLEMFGKDASVNEPVSEDEDWGPGKRKRKEKDTNAAKANTLLTLSSSDMADPKRKQKEQYSNATKADTLMTLPSSKMAGSNVEIPSVEEEHYQQPHMKRKLFRIPPVAVKKLRQVFAENELPSRTVKDNLSKSLGLNPEKVNKWFKNARYLAIRSRKGEGSVRLQTSNHTCSSESQQLCKEDKHICPKKLKDYSPTCLCNTSVTEQDGWGAQSLSSIAKKKRQRRTLLGLHSSCNKVDMEFPEDVSLKQILKSTSKNRIRTCRNFRERFYGKATQVEMEMERLCRIKDRVDSMTEILNRISKLKTDSSKAAAVYGQAVIHVPMAEVREKL